MTPIELQRRGMEVLIRELGYADATRFMLQFSKGKGDYTKERRKLLAGVTLNDLLAAAEERLSAGKSGSKRPARKGRGKSA